jgi:hypothetical protein
MSTTYRNRTKLAFEALEERAVMSGNVQVQVIAGDLVVTGDNAANEIEIVSTGVIDGFKVVGVGTTINGRSGPFIFDNFDFSDDIQIDMKGGRDIVRMYGADADIGDLDAWNDLTINMGEGNDCLFLKNIQAGGQGAADSDIIIDMGRGNNLLRADFLDVGDDLRISTPDISPVSSTTKTRLDLRDLTVADQVDIDLRWCIGVVNLNRVRCDDLLVDLYGQNDRLSVLKSTARVVDLDGGAGDDDLNLLNNSSQIHTASNRAAFKSPTAKSIFYS